MNANYPWKEELPDNCPPESAFSPGGVVFYRLVETYPPSEVDFQSTRRRSPNRKMADECTMRACSVFSTYESCERAKKVIKIKNLLIIKLILPPESGVIQQTFSDPNHYSWWIRKGFNPLAYCQEV